MATSTSAMHPHQQQQHHHQPQQQQQQQQQGLPSISSLTNGLPPSSHNASPDPTSASESTRDSGTWPGSQSKHTSANSGLQVHTLLNPDESPSRASVPTTPLSGRGLSSAQSANAVLPSINQGFSDPGNRDSRDSAAFSMDSRRSSVDSRMHQGMNNLYINSNNQPGSPYESANASQVSLAASLRRPNNGAPVSPLNNRTGLARPSTQPRVAPPIIGRVPGAPDPTAARPTAGFAWAFPDSTSIPEERRGSDSGDSSVGMSRQNSFTASSIRSSVFSGDSHLPPGQRRLDEDHPTTHHHTMQHRAIQGLQQEVAGQAVGNYSRTPELRVSHKLAERKRRSEMKDLFEELNKAVPSAGGTKASKWEILMKAIEYINKCQHNERLLQSEVQRLQRDADYARDAHKENEMLRTEIQVMHQHLRRLDPSAPHVYGHLTSQLSNGNPNNSSNNNSGSNPANANNGGNNPPSSSGGPPHQQQQQQQQQGAQQPQTNGSPGNGPPSLSQGISLPPMQHHHQQQQQQQQQHGYGPPPGAAMQGVEYGAGGGGSGYGR